MYLFRAWEIAVFKNTEPGRGKRGKNRKARDEVGNVSETCEEAEEYNIRKYSKRKIGENWAGGLYILKSSQLLF
jgi:hypothetical protein